MKRLDKKRRQKLTREFPGLDQVPAFEWVKRIDVQRVDLFLLQGSGVITLSSEEYKNTFYAVFSGEVKHLEANKIYDRPSFDSRPDIRVLSNGEQIFRISSRPPDFIVEIRGEDSSHGNTIDACIIYKTDKFDWDGYFEREVKSRLKKVQPI